MPLDYLCEYCNTYRTFQNSQEKFYWIGKHRNSKKHRRNAAIRTATDKSASLSVKELQDQITDLDSKDDIFSKAMRGILREILARKQENNGELFQ